MDGTIRNYEVIAAIIILTREILTSGLREFLAKGKIKLPVSNLAKLKTVLQMFTFRASQIEGFECSDSTNPK